MNLKRYTVLLTAPDYVAENYGVETYMARVVAATPALARFAAQTAAIESAIEGNDGDPEDHCVDHWHVIAIFEGHLEDLSP